jgi:hypothetical protein
MSYALADGVSCCMVGDQPVFLDLRSDRYSSLNGAARDIFSRLVAREEIDCDALGLLEPLVSARLLVPAGRGQSISPCAAHDAIPRDFAPRQIASQALRHVPRALFHLVSTKIALRRGRLHSLIERLRMAKGSSLGVRRADLSAIVIAFRYAGLIISPRDQCLRRSIAMARQLLHAGYRPDLVIGVTLAPFRAHSWVELDGAVLNDLADNVRPFTPILVV